MDDIGIMCYGIIIFFVFATLFITYVEITAEYVNTTQKLVNKQIIHNNRFPDNPDVYRLYTNTTFDVMLEDYNSVEIGDNLTIGFSESTHRSKLYLNNKTYE